MKFIDEATITVLSGKGGSGSVSFRRESHVPRGGPDGGDGGKGGDVIFKVNSRLKSLLDFRYKKKYQAQNGEPGRGQNQSGSDGKDAVIELPVGTVVYQGDEVVVDIHDDTEFVFLKGGRGGKGNVFYKSSIHQAPQIAQKGEPGAKAQLQLQLKLIADVGLIGFPNVGKSTLIANISAAKPKIANYEFTTLVPNLGVVKIDEEKNFVVADIPGLIEGAHKGVGLGYQFLKHIERTGVFVHVIDVSDFTDRDPLKDYKKIRQELELYVQDSNNKLIGEPLTARPEIVVLNKIDTIDEKSLERIIDRFCKVGIKVLPISAVTGKNISTLKFTMAKYVFKNEVND